MPSTDEEERNEVKNTIQQTVSHFTSNTNKVRFKKESGLFFYTFLFIEVFPLGNLEINIKLAITDVIIICWPNKRVWPLSLI